MSTQRFLWWAWGVFALALFGSGEARALTNLGPVNTHGPNYGSGYVNFVDGSTINGTGRTWTNPSARVVQAADSLIARVGGNDLTLTATRTMTPTAIQRASALALKGLPVVGTGIAVWELWNLMRVQPDGAGGLVSDPGVAPGTTSSDCWTDGTTGATCYGTKTAAAVAKATAVDALNNSCPGGTYRVTLSPTTETMVSGNPNIWDINVPYDGKYCSNGSAAVNNVTRIVRVWNTPTSGTECPASIDPYDPARSLPAGLPVGPDGKCRQARGHWDPISADAAAAKNEAGNPPSGATLKDLAEHAVANGQGIEASDRTMSGPGSVTGTPVSSTSTDGTTTTTMTKTPTTNYTYSTNTVNYTITTVTVISDGTTTTTTTTTEGEPADSDQCKKNPDSLGCVKMGDPPTDAPTWETREVPWEVEDLGFTGACPADEAWEVAGIELSWSYTPICDVAPMVRLALLVIAGIGAISVVIRETAG